MQTNIAVHDTQGNIMPTNPNRGATPRRIR